MGTMEISELLASYFVICICPLKPDILLLIFSRKPSPVAIAINMIINPNEIAEMAIFIIGDDILLLYSLPEIIRFATNNS